MEVGVFEQYPLLVADPSASRLIIDRLFGGNVGKNRLWHMPSMESVRELARVGQAIALLPDRLAAKSVELGHLVRLSVAAPRFQRTCAVHWSGQMELSWAAEVFISLVAMVAQEDESPGEE